MPESTQPRGAVAAPGIDDASDDDFLFDDEEFGGAPDIDGNDDITQGLYDEERHDDEQDLIEGMSLEQYDQYQAQKLRERRRQQDRQQDRHTDRRQDREDRGRDRNRAPQTPAENAAFAKLRRASDEANRSLITERLNTAQMSVQLNENRIKLRESEIKDLRAAHAHATNEGDADKAAEALAELIARQGELAADKIALKDAKDRVEKFEAEAKRVSETKPAGPRVPRAMREWASRLLVSEWPQECQLTVQGALEDAMEMTDMRADNPDFFRLYVNPLLRRELSRTGHDIQKLVHAANRKVFGNPPGPKARNGRPTPTGDGDGGQNQRRQARHGAPGRYRADGTQEPRALEPQEMKFLRSQGRDPNDQSVRDRWFKRHPEPWRAAERVEGRLQDGRGLRSRPTVPERARGF